MGRYDGEDYEPVVPCASGQHMPVPNGQCHVCRQTLTAKERRDGEAYQALRTHQRDHVLRKEECPTWCPHHVPLSGASGETR